MPRYTDEKNAQILIALLKEYKIRKVIVSPGTTNVPFSGSVQNDPFFEVYSAYDERSAAYMACGLANESQEPVVLSCTGATASRNYLSGLTEAYYRKLPVLAVTSMNSTHYIGNLMEQTLDRSRIQRDVARCSINLEPVKDAEDYVYTELAVNRALSELTRHGGGPVHIQLISNYAGTFNTVELPQVRRIARYTHEDEWPLLDRCQKIAIVLGAEPAYSAEQIASLESFVESSNAVVLTNNVSGYHGKYAIQASLACQQLGGDNPQLPVLTPDLVIHIGEQSGSYEINVFIGGSSAKVWRVSSDGEIRKRFSRLDSVFESSGKAFFDHYAQCDGETSHTYFASWQSYDMHVRSMIPEFPFSNLWIGNTLSKAIPANSAIHFGILNSVRSWNNYVLDSSITTTANVGGFGIDGDLSALVGSSLAEPARLHFGIFGDLAFFYDMNVLGNRHLGSNIRILLVNNNVGAEFKMSTHMGSQFGEHTDDYIAAGRHNINHFANTVRRGRPEYDASPAQAWAESLGLRYLSAANKDEFNAVYEDFLSRECDRPILFECFTTPEDEDEAHNMVLNIDTSLTLKGEMKQALKKVLPRTAIHQLKKVVG